MRRRYGLQVSGAIGVEGPNLFLAAWKPGVGQCGEWWVVEDWRQGLMFDSREAALGYARRESEKGGGGKHRVMDYVRLRAVVLPPQGKRGLE